jgi:hypothetical protein
MFCQETVEELLKLVKANKKFPSVLMVFPAEISEGKEFFDRFWPEARAVSDPKGDLYRILGVKRASLRQMFGPGVWFRAVQAMKAGYTPGKVIGNPWLLPAMYLVRNGEIKWSWAFKNIGDQPMFEQIFKTIKEEDQ